MKDRLLVNLMTVLCGWALAASSLGAEMFDVNNPPAPGEIIAPSSMKSRGPASPLKLDGVEQELYLAVSKGNLKKLTELARGKSVNFEMALTTSGKTPLMIAATRGDLKIVELLYRWGVDLNQVDQKGSTALIAATVAARSAVVKFLLDKGADRNLVRDNGDRALDIAIRWRKKDLVKLLQEEGKR